MEPYPKIHKFSIVYTNKHISYHTADAEGRVLVTFCYLVAGPHLPYCAVCRNVVLILQPSLVVLILI